MGVISFKIPGEPQGKGRPRFSRAGKHVKTYTPDKTASYENLIKLEFERQCGETFFQAKTPIKMIIDAVFSIPTSATKAQRIAMLDGQILPTKKPDADNILKIVADALNGLAYHDDAQIVATSVFKRYGETPQTIVYINKIGKEEE